MLQIVGSVGPHVCVIVVSLHSPDACEKLSCRILYSLDVFSTANWVERDDVGRYTDLSSSFADCLLQRLSFITENNENKATITLNNLDERERTPETKGYHISAGRQYHTHCQCCWMFIYR
jgi:hypothetical protein